MAAAAPTQPGPPPVRTVRTSAGRVVSLYEYGDPRGAPLFVLHGTPMCGAGFAWADGAARERGLRLVAPDRPGIGLSDRVRMPLVAGYGPEPAAIADALGIERFGVLGYSGGGPHALAAAHATPERVAVAGVVAGQGQIGAWAAVTDFEADDEVLLPLSVRRPRAARLVLATLARGTRLSPRLAVRAFERGLSPEDRAAFPRAATATATMAPFTQAFLRGAAGMVDDYARLARGWGFQVENVTVPVLLWHGDRDPMVPLAHSRALSERLRDRPAVTTWAGAGHFGIVTRIGHVLDELRTVGSLRRP